MSVLGPHMQLVCSGALTRTRRNGLFKTQLRLREGIHGRAALKLFVRIRRHAPDTGPSSFPIQSWILESKSALNLPRVTPGELVCT